MRIAHAGVEWRLRFRYFEIHVSHPPAGMRRAIECVFERRKSRAFAWTPMGKGRNLAVQRGYASVKRSLVVWTNHNAQEYDAGLDGELYCRRKSELRDMRRGAEEVVQAWFKAPQHAQSERRQGR